jgi:tetratricopeptide (TPR) repeat protein
LRKNQRHVGFALEGASTVNRDNRPPPLAEGSFAQKPFPHILVYLMQKKLTGTLEVQAMSQSAAVYFRDGMPGKVRATAKGRELGQVLLEMGLVTEHQLSACQKEMAESGGYQGQILIKRGAIDAAGMVRGLRMQMLHKLVGLFAMTDAGFAFYDRVNLLVGDGPDEVFPVDPYPVLMAGVRAHGASLPLDTVIKALDGRWMSFTSVDALKRFRLNESEKEICRAILAKPRTYFELVSTAGVDLAALRALLYVALITKELALTEKGPDLGTPSIPPPERPRLDSSPPPPAGEHPYDPEAAAQRDNILAKAAAIANQNYFEMLELPLGSPIEEVRRAFFKLAKTYHPDRAKGALSDLRETFEYVFSNLSEAHSTLVDPDAREEYGGAISEGIKRTSVIPPGVGEEEVREVLEAENLFQKALVLMRRNQLDKALELIDQARQLNAEQGEYIAVWAKIQILQRTADAPIDDLVSLLRHAEELSPKSERVNLYLAQALLRTGRSGEAAAHFERVLEISPRNVEAARELRLIEMRRGKEKDEKKGFMKKLFG